ncbi:MAG: ABC transporter ATP-binding protein [Bacteroidales bacterium]|nr:ABC transporter ATP-binding protein [Bacteroidales bacterium]
MKSIVSILKYLRFFPTQIILHIFFTLLYILFNLGSYVMIVPFVQLLFGSVDIPAVEPQFAFSQEAFASWAFYHLNLYRATLGLWQCLLIISAAYLACSLLSNLFRYLSTVYLNILRNGLIERLRNDLYHRITILPIAFFDHNRRGDLISRMSNDLADIEWNIVSVLQMIVKSPLNILVFCATLLFVSWRLFLLFLLIFPIGIKLVSVIGKHLKTDSRKGRTILGRMFALIDQSLDSIRVVKAFRREESLARHFASTNASFARTTIRMARRAELSSPLSEVLGTLALVIILIVGGSWVVGGHIDPSVFIFFVIIFARTIPPILAVVKAYNSLQKGTAAASRIMEVIQADEVITEAPNAPLLPPFHSSITLHDVGFHFGDGIPILSHISLTIPHGSTVAIVGPSGAGKSTLVDLLPRFYDPTSGSITIDGHNLTDLNINSLRSQFGLVSQNCILFNDTVAANIAFGADGFSLDQIRAAARAAFADDFIQSLPQAYDTTIGDRGFNLSGGQRQRISIARALLRNPSILILDEATSALDTESELAVQQGLNSLMQGRTTIAIAHRLSTIRSADLILVLDHGTIVERGTHDQLLALGGLYSKLVAMQSFS